MGRLQSHVISCTGGAILRWGGKLILCDAVAYNLFNYRCTAMLRQYTTRNYLQGSVRGGPWTTTLRRTVRGEVEHTCMQMRALITQPASSCGTESARVRKLSSYTTTMRRTCIAHRQPSCTWRYDTRPMLPAYSRLPAARQRLTTATSDMDRAISA